MFPSSPAGEPKFSRKDRPVGPRQESGVSGVGSSLVGRAFWGRVRPYHGRSGLLQLLANITPAGVPGLRDALAEVWMGEVVALFHRP